jgi:hypothetical protein
VAFTLQTYTHVIPGMDQQAADTVAALILGPRLVEQPDGSILGSIEGARPSEIEADLGESPGQRQ